MSPVSRARKLLDWIAGIALILFGIAGLVLPGIPGVLPILGGLAILSSHSTLARRTRDAILSRMRQARERILKR